MLRGSVKPDILKRIESRDWPALRVGLGREPATASAPLITSLADIAGVLIYFSIASWYFGLG